MDYINWKVKMNSCNSFKSFEAIISEIQIRQMLKAGFENYFAHLHEKKPAETLNEHTERVCQFALQLIQVHHLEPVIHRLIQSILEQDAIQPPDEVGNLIKEFFINAIVYHDIGKINENFQIERMRNSFFLPNRANAISSRHSILSAFVYISTNLLKIYRHPNLTDKSKYLLYVLSFLFSVPILKHHASFIETEINFPDELLEALQPYLKKVDFELDLHTVILLFKDHEQALKEFSHDICPETCYFSIFALLKLCYSLLTAADYCATSHYAMDLEIDSFGILSSEEKDLLLSNFQTIKSYNKNFFNNRDDIKKLSFEKLNQCNPDNLNLLRQKLMDEVLSAIESNPTQQIFYMEAPTGSGKTNMSLAAALLLLKNHSELNKIYYVFPFTTLITQTAKSIYETLNLSPDLMIQLHSRSGFTPKREGDDSSYEQLNYIDYLFVNYPIILLTHVKFFDILKTNSKESNYIFHRLANSVIIIDELQSYPPREWDKIVFYINQMAYFFNIKFILMSATLPKLDKLDVLHLPLQFSPLIQNKNHYFQNPNFRERVRFDFSLLDDKLDMDSLAHFVIDQTENYAMNNDSNVKAIIEFIYKRSAGDFYKTVEEIAKEKGYKLFLLSGTILEPRRREIIDLIKNPDAEWRKILLITTQVVEAGVDIDMDIGFKDKSLIDSDEQLAGRVNRNARSEPSQVFIFNLDPAFRIYGSDLRYKITRDHINDVDYQNILSQKNFDLLYEKVCQKINEENANEYMQNFFDYKKLFKKTDFKKIDWEFKIIDQKNITIYIPLQIPANHFTNQEKLFLENIECYDNGNFVDGEEVWYKYLEIVQAKNLDFIKKKIELKKLYSIMSQFMISIHIHSNLLKELIRFCDQSYYEKYEILYLHGWKDVYDYFTGINDEKFTDPALI